MTLYAFDAIDDAFEATRAFLWPFDLGRWARLALVVFFLGGVGGFNPFQFNPGSTGGGGEPGTPGDTGMPAAPDAMPEIGGQELAIIVLGVLAVITLLVLAFLLVGSIMEFVFVESLRREAVTVRRYWGEHWGKGVRLFLFRLIFGLITLVTFFVLAFISLAPLLGFGGSFSLGILLVGILVLAILAIVSGLINGFTTVFVVPIMIEEDRGLLSAWSRFWPTMTGQWKQYAVYAIMGFVLQLAGGIVAGIAALVALIALAIPFGIVAVIGWGLLQVASIAGWVVIGAAAVLFVLSMIVAVLFISMPIQAFLRYYALFVLGDTNEAFDLIPERRRIVREEGTSPSGAAG